jgi:transposase
LTRGLRRDWVRWYASQRVPPDHIAAILGTDVETVEADLGIRRQRRKPHLPLGKGSPHRRRPARRAILSMTVTHIERLRSLGYAAERVAEILKLDPARVTDFLNRTAPIRGTVRSRPRSREEEVRARANQARREARKRELAAWGDKHEPPAVRPIVIVPEIAAAPELMDDQASAEPPAIEASPPHEWSGSASMHDRAPKLIEAQVLEAGELLRSGLSYPAVAKRFGVSVNTLRRYVTDVGPRRSAVPWPTEAVRYDHGVMRWDLPLVLGRKTKVLVECECGNRRQIDATTAARPDQTFTGACDACKRRLTMFSDQERAEIRRLHESGLSMRKIAKRFDCSYSTIYEVVHRPSPAPPAEGPG